MRHARSDYNRIQDPAGLIPEDEPVFLLRGQDKLAAKLVFEWSKRARAAGVDPTMCDMAFDQAERMSAWRPRKTADLPEDGR